MIRQRLIPLFLFAAWLLSPVAAYAQEAAPTRLDITAKDIESSLEDEWMGLYFQNTKIGYFNVKRTKETEDKNTFFYREHQVTSMKLQSLNQKTELKIEQTLDFEDKPPYRLLRAEYQHNDDKTAESISLTYDADEKNYEAVIVVGTVEQKKRISELDFTLADLLSSDVWIKRQPKKGYAITTRELDMDNLRLDLVTSSMVGTKESVVNGVKVTYHEVKSVYHKTGITAESRYDDKGRIISQTIAGAFEARREKPEDAKNTEYSVDLFIFGLAKLDKALGDDGAKLTGLVLELKGKDFADLPQGPRQSVVAKGNDVYHIQLGKKYGKQIKATESDIKEALEETVTYPFSDAKVLALAKKAAADGKTDEEKAKNICKFVHDFIEPSLATSGPKMHDLMVRKSGDCKSYALMFTCLARAIGLPSREVSGFVYMGDSVKSFGGHAWNEVLLNGMWVPVDASMNQVDADPTHICLGTEKESANNLLRTLGKLDFKLVEVQR